MFHRVSWFVSYRYTNLMLESKYHDTGRERNEFFCCCCW